MLGWEEIPARIVHLDSILEGEFAENEMRKDFTKSERVAIAAALEMERGERRGNPNLRKCHDSSIVEPVPHLESGEKTRDIVAKKAGLGSGKTFEQAKTVVDHGIDEVREAMDNDKISVKDAATIAKQPAED